QSDCAGGTVCAIVENVGQTALESVCIPNSGGGTSGAMCVSDNECGSLVCLGGFCSARCTSTTQCGMGQICQNATVSKSGLMGTFKVCETLPEQQCTASSDCTDGVRECGDLRTNPSVALFCDFPNPGQGAIGDACANDTECFTNLCADFSSNECTVGCDIDADCGAGQICTAYQFNMTTVGMCARSCSDND